MWADKRNVLMCLLLGLMVALWNATFFWSVYYLPASHAVLLCNMVGINAIIEKIL